MAILTEKADNLNNLSCYTAAEIITARFEDGAFPLMLSAVRVVNGRSVGKFKTLIDPGRPVEGFVDPATGVNSRLLSGAPGAAAMLPAFAAFVGEGPLIGENIAENALAVREACSKLGVDFNPLVIDISLLGAELYPGLEDYELGTLYLEFFGRKTIDRRVDSVADVAAKCVEFMKRFMEREGLAAAASPLAGAEENGQKAVQTNEPPAEEKNGNEPSRDEKNENPPSAAEQTAQAEEKPQEKEQEAARASRKQRRRAKAAKIERIISSYDSGEELPDDEPARPEVKPDEIGARQRRRPERGGSPVLSILLVLLTLGAAALLILYTVRLDKRYLIAACCIAPLYIILCAAIGRKKR